MLYVYNVRISFHHAGVVGGACYANVTRRRSRMRRMFGSCKYKQGCTSGGLSPLANDLTGFVMFLPQIMSSSALTLCLLALSAVAPYRGRASCLALVRRLLRHTPEGVRVVLQGCAESKNSVSTCECMSRTCAMVFLGSGIENKFLTSPITHLETGLGMVQDLLPCLSRALPVRPVFEPPVDHSASYHIALKKKVMYLEK